MKTLSGKSVHPLGQGSWTLGGVFEMKDGKPFNVSKNTDEVEIKGVQCALDHGINYIDACHHYGYGKSVELLAKALEGRNREDLFINAKLEIGYTSYAEIKQKCDEYLLKLGIDYIDSYQIHASMKHLDHTGVVDTVQELIQDQKVRHIGVSNFNSKQLQEVVTCGITPISHELYFNLITRFNEELDIIQKGESLGIKTLVYKPIMRNALSSMKIPLLDTLTDKYNVTTNQVLLNRLVNRRGYASIIKSTNPKHIAENIKSLDFDMTLEEYESLDAYRPHGYKTPEIDRTGDNKAFPRPWKV